MGECYDLSVVPSILVVGVEAFLSPHCLIASQVQSTCDSFLMNRVMILSSGLSPCFFSPALLSDSGGEQEWEMFGGWTALRFSLSELGFPADSGCRSMSADVQGEHKCWLLIAEMCSAGPTAAAPRGPWPFSLHCRRTRHGQEEAGRPTGCSHAHPACSAALQGVAKLGLQSPPTLSCDRKTHLRLSEPKMDRYNMLFPSSAPQSTENLLDTAICANPCLNFLLLAFLS